MYARTLRGPYKNTLIMITSPHKDDIQHEIQVPPLQHEMQLSAQPKL